MMTIFTLQCSDCAQHLVVPVKHQATHNYGAFIALYKEKHRVGDLFTPAEHLRQINDELPLSKSEVDRNFGQVQQHVVDVERFSFGKGGHTWGRDGGWDFVVPFCELH